MVPRPAMAARKRVSKPERGQEGEPKKRLTHLPELREKELLEQLHGFCRQPPKPETTPELQQE